MMLLKSNQRTIWYANRLSSELSIDADGNETGEYIYGYTTPTPWSANVSPAKGESTIRQFGETEQYDKVIVGDRIPADGQTVFWIDNLFNGTVVRDPDGEPIEHDYIVHRIADGLNSFAIAVKKVTIT